MNELAQVRNKQFYFLRMFLSAKKIKIKVYVFDTKPRKFEPAKITAYTVSVLKQSGSKRHITISSQHQRNICGIYATRMYC